MPDIFNGKIENVRVGNQYVSQIKTLYRESAESQTIETTLWEKSATIYTSYTRDNYITIDQMEVIACGEFSKYQVGDVITDPTYPLNSDDQVNVTGVLTNSSLTNLYSTSYDINYTCKYTNLGELYTEARYEFPFPLTTKIHDYIDSVTAKITLVKKDTSTREYIVRATDFHVVAKSSPNWGDAWGSNIKNTVDISNQMPLVVNGMTAQNVTLVKNWTNCYLGVIGDFAPWYYDRVLINTAFIWQCPNGDQVNMPSGTIMQNWGSHLESEFRGSWIPLMHIFTSNHSVTYEGLDANIAKQDIEQEAEAQGYNPYGCCARYYFYEQYDSESGNSEPQKVVWYLYKDSNDVQRIGEWVSSSDNEEVPIWPLYDHTVRTLYDIPVILSQYYNDDITTPAPSNYRDDPQYNALYTAFVQANATYLEARDAYRKDPSQSNLDAMETAEQDKEDARLAFIAYSRSIGLSNNGVQIIEENIYFKPWDIYVRFGFQQTSPINTYPSNTEYHYSVNDNTIGNMIPGESKTVTLTWNGL